MTEQEIIPGKRYRHLDHPQTKYEGRGTVNPETLDCENRHMIIVEDFGPCRLPYGQKVIPLQFAQRGFWLKFSPINA